MRKIVSFSTIAATSLVLVGCATTNPQPQMTPLQIQAMQTRTYKHTNKRKVFNAAMQVFQDLGYTVKSANYNTGFISAQSLTKNTSDNVHGFLKFVKVVNELNGNGNHRSTTGLTKATAFISQAPGRKIRLRVSFVNVQRTSVNGGSPTENDKQILNAKAYTTVFNRVRQQIFVGNAVS